MLEKYLNRNMYIKRWAEHTACMGDRRCVYRVLVGRLEGKRPLYSASPDSSLASVFGQTCLLHCGPRCTSTLPTTNNAIDTVPKIQLILLASLLYSIHIHVHLPMSVPILAW
jgi:hypothetical protein